MGACDKESLLLTISFTVCCEDFADACDDDFAAEGETWCDLDVDDDDDALGFCAGDAVDDDDGLVVADDDGLVVADDEAVVVVGAELTVAEAVLLLAVPLSLAFSAAAWS